MSRRRLNHRRIPLAPDQMADVAGQVNDDHARWSREGLTLTRASAVTMSGDGTISVRLVYRDRTGGRSATVSVRGLTIGPAA